MVSVNPWKIPVLVRKNLQGKSYTFHMEELWRRESRFDSAIHYLTYLQLIEFYISRSPVAKDAPAK